MTVTVEEQGGRSRAARVAVEWEVHRRCTAAAAERAGVAASRQARMLLPVSRATRCMQSLAGWESRKRWLLALAGWSRCFGDGGLFEVAVEGIGLEVVRCSGRVGMVEVSWSEAVRVCGRRGCGELGHAGDSFVAAAGVEVGRRETARVASGRRRQRRMELVRSVVVGRLERRSVVGMRVLINRSALKVFKGEGATNLAVVEDWAYNISGGFAVVEHLERSLQHSPELAVHTGSLAAVSLMHLKGFHNHGRT